MTGSYASPPCFAHELTFGPDGAEVRDGEMARDVARWRKAERQRLIENRLAVPAAERAASAKIVSAGLDRSIADKSDPIIGLYWPFRGELDLREWMGERTMLGARIVLPVVVRKAAPLEFREWRPGCAMERGVWNIPIPTDGEVLSPNIVVAPVVGANSNAFRLGYGGGFYDRTLAGMVKRPLVIGIGHPTAWIETIYPQPHDIPMDVVILGGDVWRRPT